MKNLICAFIAIGAVFLSVGTAQAQEIVPITFTDFPLGEAEIHNAFDFEVEQEPMADGRYRAEVKIQVGLFNPKEDTRNNPSRMVAHTVKIVSISEAEETYVKLGKGESAELRPAADGSGLLLTIPALLPGLASDYKAPTSGRKIYGEPLIEVERGRWYQMSTQSTITYKNEKENLEFEIVQSSDCVDMDLAEEKPCGVDRDKYQEIAREPRSESEPAVLTKRKPKPAARKKQNAKRAARKKQNAKARAKPTGVWSRAKKVKHY